MQTRKDIQLDLLRKLNELSEEANVSYALHKQAAILAYKNESINEMESLDVIMCQGDAEKIADILNDDAYYFEDFRSNPKFDKNMMMFGFKNSLDFKLIDMNFQTDRHIDNHCIRINIHFINHQIPKGQGKKLKSQQRLWNLRYLKLINNKFWKCKLHQKILNIICFFIGNERANRIRYENKKRNYAIDTWTNIKKYPFVRVSGRKFNSDIFEKLISKELDGVPTFILEDFEPFIFNFYGKNWKEKEWKLNNGYKSSIISWEEFSNDFKLRESLEIIQRCDELNYIKRMEMEEYKKTSTNLKRQIIQSENVVKIRKDMLNKKEKIIDLYKIEDERNLKIELDPLIKSLKKSMELGYTYSVDEDIDNILYDYLGKNQEIELLNNIKKLKIEI
ncbi:MAG: hypothetical protein E7Z75_01165 [Methanobrevibacter olleyae]|uniref:Uncharacterized protein n=1 Tax=Methanobrevibacter olleyae TaxID=294671 RepID=A0A8T3VTL2_METOL|nr:hypothetical protein [Methanobrevibacter olleyae]